MNKYYDGTKLLSLKDLDGNQPELYFITTNRTAGKTTWFNRLAVNRFKRGQIRKFALIYRFNYELSNCGDKFFKDINTLFFPDDVMTSKSQARGVYHELFLNDVSCGYAVALNSADQIKKYSHLLSDIDMFLFDEFQSETNHYCDNEIAKLLSIHTSIARGQGEQVRYVPVYMIGNPVSMLNPYYSELGISTRLNDRTKFIKGHGWVLEQGYVESAEQAQEKSSFNRAFSNASYIAYSKQGLYLNDNNAFVEKPSGTNRYLATLKYNNKEYAVREYADMGIVYCDDKPDVTYKYKISITTNDHGINYVMLRKNDLFIATLRYYFEQGCFRFKNLECKDVIIKAIKY